MQRGELQEKYRKIIENLVDKLHDILLSTSFEKICKIYKEISIKLNYLLRKTKLDLSQNPELQNELRLCMSLIQILLQSTEYQKYSHRFPLLHKLLKNYELFTQKKLQPVEKQKVMKLIHKNQKSSFYRADGLQNISSQEIKLLNSDKPIDFFSWLMSQDMILQNPQCVCCSPVFIKNFKIVNKNPLISVVAQLSQKKGFDQIIFQNYVNAVCNKRGGAIIIGAEKKNGDEIVSGIRFKNMEEIIKRQTQIRMTLQRLNLICQYLIQRVLVHTNYINPRKIGQENMRICFRILLFPYEPEKVAYNEILNKGYHRIYEVFKFDYLKKPYKVTSAINSEPKECESLYTMIHEKYRQSRKIVNSHQNIECSRPHPHYSKIFQKYVQEGCPLQPEEFSQDSQQFVIHEDEPKFKYPHTSLLVVSSKQSKRYIKDFGKLLKDKKQLFQIIKPFQNSFRDEGRLVQMISHQCNIIQLKDYRKELQVKSMLKQSPFILMPVYNTFRIQLSKYNENKQRIEKRFLARYEKLYETQIAQIIDQHKKVKTVTYLHFTSYSQAIYTYLIFESLLLKPYFTKEGTNPNFPTLKTYKK